MKLSKLNKSAFIYSLLIFSVICFTFARYYSTRMLRREKFVPLVAICQVIGLPEKYQDQYRYKVRITHLLSQTEATHNLQHQTNLKLKTELPLKYGDILSLNGFVSAYNTITSNHITHIDSLPNPLINTIFAFRNSLEQRIYRIMPPDHANLALGMTLGSTSQFQPSTKEAFQTTSVMHMVVVSGYNISIIVAITMSTASRLSRRYSIFLTFVVIAWFVTLSGADPPSVRAALMSAFTLTGQLFGRLVNGKTGFLVSILVMTIHSPQIVHSLSFQLSVAATAGILYLQPTIHRILASMNIINNFAGEISTTIAAQLAVTPLILYNFHTLSQIGLFANLLVGWTVPFIMLGTTILIVSTLFGNFVATITSFLVTPFTAYFIHTNKYLAALPYAQSSNIEISFVKMIAIYAIYAILIRIINHTKITHNRLTYK